MGGGWLRYVVSGQLLLALTGEGSRSRVSVWVCVDFAQSWHRTSLAETYPISIFLAGIRTNKREREATVGIREFRDELCVCRSATGWWPGWVIYLKQEWTDRLRSSIGTNNKKKSAFACKSNHSGCCCGGLDRLKWVLSVTPPAFQCSQEDLLVARYVLRTYWIRPPYYIVTSRGTWTAEAGEGRF